MQASGGGSISRQNKRACKRTQHVCRLWKQRLHPRRTLIQNFIEPGKEGDGSNGGRQNVADRLRQKHAEHRVGHDVGQNEDERDQQDDLAQAGQQQADLGLPQRHKALLAGDLEAHGKNAGHVNAHGPGGVGNECGIGGEDARHGPGHQHHGQPEQAGVCAAQGQLEPESLLYAGLFAGSEVEAHHRLAALAHALNGQCAQLGGAGDHGHGTHSHVAAVAGQTGAEADGEQTLGGKHHKGGDAQCQHRQDDRFFQPEKRPAQVQDRLFAGEELQDPRRAHGLTEHRGNGCALHAQPKPEDEDGVQNDVDHGTDHGGEHAGLGKALGGDEGIHAQHQQHEHRAENVDAAVAQRIRQGGVTGTEQPQQRGRTRIKADGQHHCKEHQHRKAVGDDLFGLLPIPLPQCDGGARCTARAHQHGERVQQHEDGREQSHAGERGCADALNVPDVNAVYDVVQQVHHLRHHGRDHQLQHQLFYAAGPHVLFCLCHRTKTPFASNLNDIPFIIIEIGPKG